MATMDGGGEEELGDPLIPPPPDAGENDAEVEATNGDGNEGQAEDDSDDDSSDEDDFQITIGEIKTGSVSFGPKSNSAPKIAAGAEAPVKGKLDVDAVAEVDGVPIYDADIASMDKKPWREPGADLTDYFNYGFTEESWNMYCERQRKLRAEYGPVAANRQLFASLSVSSSTISIPSNPSKIPTLGAIPTQPPPPQYDQFGKKVPDVDPAAPIVIPTVNLARPNLAQPPPTIARIDLTGRGRMAQPPPGAIPILVPSAPPPQASTPPPSSVAAAVEKPPGEGLVPSNPSAEEAPATTPPPGGEPVDVKPELSLPPQTQSQSMPNLLPPGVVNTALPPPGLPPGFNAALPPPGFAPHPRLPIIPGLPPPTLPPGMGVAGLLPPGVLPPGLPNLANPPPPGVPGAPFPPPIPGGPRPPVLGRPVPLMSTRPRPPAPPPSYQPGTGSPPQAHPASPADYSDRSSDEERRGNRGGGGGGGGGSAYRSSRQRSRSPDRRRSHDYRSSRRSHRSRSRDRSSRRSPNRKRSRKEVKEERISDDEQRDKKKRSKRERSDSRE